MARKRISEETKHSLLKRLKSEGLSVQSLAVEADIHPQTIYNWLANETKTTGVSWREYRKMKQENQQLKEIIGHLTLDMTRTKKI